MSLANDSVQKTLCMPLWAREIGARKYPQLLPDHDAERILAEFDAGRPTLMYHLQYFYLNVVIRHWNYAAEIEAYLAAHPKATIVEMGAGLSCQRRQMAAAGRAGVDNRWYAVDYADVIALREEHVPDDGVERRLAADLMDFAWMDAIEWDPDQGIFFTGSGLFYYFTMSGGRGLICELARRFPGGALAFDIANHTGSKGVNKEIEASGIDVRINDDRNFYLDEPKDEVESWDPAIANVEERPFFDGYLNPKTYRRSPATCLFQWILQHFRLGFFVHVDFKRPVTCG